MWVPHVLCFSLSCVKIHRESSSCRLQSVSRSNEIGVQTQLSFIPCLCWERETACSKCPVLHIYACALSVSSPHLWSINSCLIQLKQLINDPHQYPNVLSTEQQTFIFWETPLCLSNWLHNSWYDDIIPWITFLLIQNTLLKSISKLFISPITLSSLIPLHNLISEDESYDWKKQYGSLVLILLRQIAHTHTHIFKERTVQLLCVSLNHVNGEELRGLSNPNTHTHTLCHLYTCKCMSIDRCMLQ